MSGGATLDVAYESGCPSGGADLLGDPSEDVGGPGYTIIVGVVGERGGRRVGRCVISALDTIHPAAWRRWTRRVCCCILSVSALS